MAPATEIVVLPVIGLSLSRLKLNLVNERLLVIRGSPGDHRGPRLVVRLLVGIGRHLDVPQDGLRVHLRHLRSQEPIR